MKKIVFIVLAGLYACSAFAASDKDTAAVVKDEKADNTQHKPVVKNASPKATQHAKEEADKTKAQAEKGDAKSVGGMK
ncbi:hypothetical protein [Noviherbaspirillum pedocola]|uniref:Uncharacterized protein n=1 Tax=Noviherbaspirillum pedocola TaxID=2801341 RepID=A0A934SRK8_9BURK|nr:hypothetical protein [Noviherbaspirillum pedocola]MBK4735300.1 hypothetical protein [Noviherbaspirillum pedocola]